MFIKRTWLGLVLTLLAPGPVLAWGPEVHEIIAHIAARQLSPRARAAVGALLGGDAEAMMVTEANWADEIRDSQPQTGGWHFVDIERDSASFVAGRDCPGSDCVVAQIDKDAKIVADRRRREYESVFAGNVVLSRRPEAQRPDAGRLTATAGSSATPPRDAASPSIDDIADAEGVDVSQLRLCRLTGRGDPVVESTPIVDRFGIGH